jgi:hypothetical protein
MKKQALILIIICLAGIAQAISPANTEVLGNEFEFVDVRLDETGNLHWSTANEELGELFIVEQYVYNRWTSLTTISGAGLSNSGEYMFRVANVLHSGTNSFRIRKPAKNYIDILSEVVDVESELQKVYHFEKKDRILLSKRVEYCLYDESGILLKKSYGSVIHLENMIDKSFYLCYDNQVARIKKNFLSF